MTQFRIRQPLATIGFSGDRKNFVNTYLLWEHDEQKLSEKADNLF